jgi:hypothetical protein
MWQGFFEAWGIIAVVCSLIAFALFVLKRTMPGGLERKKAKLPGMEQADEIRRQDIRRIVLAKLQGFPIRQAIREATRARKRKKKEPPKEAQELMFP